MVGLRAKGRCVGGAGAALGQSPMGQRRMLARSQRAKNRVQQAALGGLLHNYRNRCRDGAAAVGASPTPSLTGNNAVVL